METILVLTDHRTHTPTDSIYEICTALSAHQPVFMASRGDSRNQAFFTGAENSIVYAKTWDADCGYSQREHWYDDAELITVAERCQGILLRIDAPLADSFLDSTYNQLPLPVLNTLDGIKSASQRSFLEHFASITPHSLYARSLDEAAEFIRSYDAVVKLDSSYGGQGVFRFIEQQRLTEFENVAPVILTKIEENIREYGGVLIQEYLPRVSEGDKRLLVAFGESLGSFIRYPTADNWLCNVAHNASISISDISDEDINIIKTVDPILKEIGVRLYSIDTLVGNDGRRLICEINVTNVGGFAQLEQLGRNPVLSQVATDILEYFSAQ